MKVMSILRKIFVEQSYYEAAKRGDNVAIVELIKVMSYRRQYKTFLVDKKNGEFRGFRN